MRIRREALADGTSENFTRVPLRPAPVVTMDLIWVTGQQFVDGGRRLRREERTYGLVERESRAWILEISWIRFILFLISYVHI